MNEGGGVRLVPGLAVRAGQTIAGKYRVEELIGRGPSGVVISARNIHLREQVTLKILASYTDDQDELLKRRLSKARLASALRSEHVARIVDIGVTDDGMPYVATEALEGVTLEAELAERGALPVEEAVRWVLEACEGLAEAHGAGLVHGDLKPQNVLLAKPKVVKRPRPAAALAPDDEIGDALDADPRVLKILDFGSTSPLDAIGDQSASAFFGSPAFVAPEQIQTPAAVDARADVWGLGVLLYNLVSGKLPFEADTLSGVIVAVVYDAPSLLTEAPYELARIVHRCLEKDPVKRPQDVRELAAALAPFAGPRGVRWSERVAAMLDASASGSIAPIALDVDRRDSEEALPLVTKRATRTAPPPSEPAEAQPTRPSQRVLAQRQRRSRVRLGAFTALGGIAALALAAWAADHSASLPSMAAVAPAEVSITSAPIATARATDLPEAPATKAADLPDAPVPPPSSTRDGLPAPAEPLVSFAPGSSDGVTSTPLAATPTPLATSEPFPPRPTLPFPSPAAVDSPSSPPPPAASPLPPAVLPAPRVVTPSTLPNAPVAGRPRRVEPRGRTPSRLPAGLPTTRDAAPSPPPYAASGTSAANNARLFSDRK